MTTDYYARQLSQLNKNSPFSTIRINDGQGHSTDWLTINPESISALKVWLNRPQSAVDEINEALSNNGENMR